MMNINLKKCTLSCAAFGLILALGACAVGPDYKKPDSPKSDSFTRDPVQVGTGSSVIKTDWWKSYNSPELNTLIDKALKHNASVEIASANLKVAQQNTVAQQGFYFPSISVGTSRTIQNNGASISTSPYTGLTGGCGGGGCSPRLPWGRAR